MARLKQKKNTAEFRGMSDGIVLFSHLLTGIFAD